MKEDSPSALPTPSKSKITLINNRKKMVFFLFLSLEETAVFFANPTESSTWNLPRVSPFCFVFFFVFLGNYFCCAIFL